MAVVLDTTKTYQRIVRNNIPINTNSIQILLTLEKVRRFNRVVVYLFVDGIAATTISYQLLVREVVDFGIATREVTLRGSGSFGVAGLDLLLEGNPGSDVLNIDFFADNGVVHTGTISVVAECFAENKTD